MAAQAHSTSQDSGLDADLGVVINGGTVCATGNMYEEISDQSTQQFAQFYFADAQTANTPLVITDADGNYLLAYTPVNAFSILEFSSSDLKDGETYYLYSGGTLTGNITNGIYTEVSDYANGTQLAHRGTSDGTAMTPAVSLAVNHQKNPAKNKHPTHSALNRLHSKKQLIIHPLPEQMPLTQKLLQKPLLTA